MPQTIAMIACLVTTLLHSAFGCCWHHGAETIATETAAASPAGQCRCTGHRETPPSKDSPANEDDRDCEANRCVYINPVVEAVSDALRIFPMGDNVRLAMDAISLPTAHFDHAQSLNISRPTVSGRLARLQVWIL